MPYNSSGRTLNRLGSRRSFQIMQATIGRLGPANDLALTMASEQMIDIVLIQEPWVGADLSRKMT